MTDNRLLKYQLLSLEGPVSKLKVYGNVNPATSFLRRKMKHLITIVPNSYLQIMQLGKI